MKGDKMNDLMIFENAEFGKVRTMNINNEPWFCLLDICKALEIKNISQLKTRLNGDGTFRNKGDKYYKARWIYSHHKNNKSNWKGTTIFYQQIFKE